MAKFLVVVESPPFSHIYETESEDELALLAEHVTMVVPKPEWWDSITDGAWVALSLSLGGIGSTEAKVHALKATQKRPA